MAHCMALAFGLWCGMALWNLGNRNRGECYFLLGIMEKFTVLQTVKLREQKCNCTFYFYRLASTQFL
jgi:hypothetical protein